MKSCGTNPKESRCWRPGENACPYAKGWKCPPLRNSSKIYDDYVFVPKCGYVRRQNIES